VIDIIKNIVVLASIESYGFYVNI